MLEGSTEDGLYCLPIDMKKRCVEVLKMEKVTLEQWHSQLGHLNAKALCDLAKDHLISVIDGNLVIFCVNLALSQKPTKPITPPNRPFTQHYLKWSLLTYGGQCHLSPQKGTGIT